MLDHVVLNISDLDASRAFYEKALAPLGYVTVATFPEGTGFGVENKPIFWIGKREGRASNVHVAIVCEDRSAVDAFHAAGLEAGGRCNGAPGIREHYHPNYYGAFLFDPDGNNIEAVCHAPVE